MQPALLRFMGDGALPIDRDRCRQRTNPSIPLSTPSFALAAAAPPRFLDQRNKKTASEAGYARLGLEAAESAEAAWIQFWRTAALHSKVGSDWILLRNLKFRR